eukprot:TRINITY_DN98_c0_g1_i2.p1 TRINITY_DN98_c0_g1~~TRINITY_DN98_c0_g1_i2.p1  ORF type:complete len:646 (+),score=226.29 TRINITY_DN98_c0_g1_i2:78-1940(+)
MAIGDSHALGAHVQAPDCAAHVQVPDWAAHDHETQGLLPAAAASDCEAPGSGESNVTLSWSGLTAHVADPVRKGEFLRVLDNVSGVVRPGEILAVMGPSGAGKTTMLNVLAGRPTLGEKGAWTGEVRLDGVDVKTCPKWRRCLGYVMQRDIFFEELSLRDTLDFTAKMRLPYHWSWQEKQAKVDELVSLMGLEKVLDTRIGTGIQRGLSGGEVKRTNMVSELLALPRLLLLDEPLTGLDSSRASQVMSILRQLAVREKRTILLTIHQPSSNMFDLFDRLLLMAPGGLCVYDGPASEATGHFRAHGFDCPSNWNPPDFFMEVLGQPDNVQELLKGRPETAPDPPEASGQLSLREMPPFWYQTMVLTERGLIQTTRAYLKPMEWVLTACISLVLGLLWWRAGDKTDTAPDNYIGLCFFFVAHWAWYSMFQGLTHFPKQRNVLAKDRASESYTITSYFISKTLCEIPVLLLMPLLFFVISFPMAGLPAQYAVQMFLAVQLVAQVAAAFSTFIGVLVFDEGKAIVAGIIFMMFTMCTGGFFVDVSKLPTWIGALRYVSFWYYALGLFMHFALKPHDNFPPEALSKHSFSDLDQGWNVLALLVNILVLRVLAYVCLVFTKKTSFS